MTVQPDGQFPLDYESREVLRDQWLAYYVEKAIKGAKRHGLSMRCETGDHGCRNNGSNCLCRCHDVSIDAHGVLEGGGSVE